jgi:hypothetical protein
MYQKSGRLSVLDGEEDTGFQPEDDKWDEEEELQKLMRRA